MRVLGAQAEVVARVCFTKGTTAVFPGWRATVIDADIRVRPEGDRLYQAIPALKESREIDVEGQCL